jgi:hypothetical protein
VGCSAEGGSADVTNPEATDEGAKLPSSSSSGDHGGEDGGNNAANGDASVDAGPPPPVPGTACKTAGEKGKKPCGACGFSEALCEDDGKGALKWSEYGVTCNDEVPNGCIPGTVVQAPCGDCGMLTKTCTQYCAFTSTSCNGQPANHCPAGHVEYTTMGCTAASTYKHRTCADTCTWSAFTTTCEAPVNDTVLTIPVTVGAKATNTITFSAAKVGSRIVPGTCPVALNVYVDHPYQYVELKNPSAKTAKVTVYTSVAPGGVVIDTVMAAYATAIVPMDDAARKACTWGGNDDMTAAEATALGSDVKFSILGNSATTGGPVVVPAGGSVIVYVGSFYGTVAVAQPTTGSLRINVRLDALN